MDRNSTQIEALVDISKDFESYRAFWNSFFENGYATLDSQLIKYFPEMAVTGLFIDPFLLKTYSKENPRREYFVVVIRRCFSSSLFDIVFCRCYLSLFLFRRL